MKKIIALLAIALGVVAPSSVLAATYYAELTVVNVTSGGGEVGISTSNSEPSEYKTDSASVVHKYTQGLFDGNKAVTFYASAKPANGYLFDGWFDNEACTGSPLSTTALKYAYKITSNSTKESSPTKKTIYAKFRDASQKIDIEDTDITLDPSTANYTGSEQTTTVTVKYGTTTLVENEDYTVSGDKSATGSAFEDKTYTVTVTGKGNYTGTASATWTIKAPTGEFDADALSTSAPGCTADGNTVTVTDSTALEYDPETLKYSATMTVTWPAPVTKSYTWTEYGSATYIDAPHAFVDAPNDVTYSGSQVLDDGTETPGLNAETAEGQYAHSLLGGNKKFTYFKSLTFTAEFTAEEVAAAVAEQKTSFDYSMTVWSVAWRGGDDDTCGSDTGLKPTTYTLTIPLEGIVLNDENGNQVYPHVDFVAEIGLKKFATLGAALDAVDEGETVTLIDEAEADDFTVPAGATLDLKGFGDEAATYVIDAIDDESAIIKSTKEETVTATTGYDVEIDTTTEPGVYIYTAKLAHQHSWTFEVEEDGITLTATCENPSCTIKGATLQLQLQGVEDKAYDGQGISAEIVDIEKDGHKFREVIEGVEVGEITYERPEYSAGKWYTGAYTASCVVTIDETPYTLEKDFEITKPEGGYTSGFEAQGVGGYDVRFDTFLEATSVANEGDTIYYKGGNLTGQTTTFSSSKNITLDLGGAKLQRDAYQTVTLTNGGEGTVTLTNGTIVQPKAGGALGSAGQMNIEGNFAFAEIETKNRATSATNFFKLTVKSGTVTVLGGKYTSQFVADGGTVVYQGGQFWDGKYGSRAYFTKPTPAEGYIVIPGEEKMDDGNGDSRDLVWKIVAHTHEFAYSAAGNVITATCNAEDHEYCGYGEETLTLTAEPREATGEPYEGASIEYSENFPVKDAEIVYFDGDQELPSAPIEVGEEYIAKVTVEDATAEAPFAITHNHQFVYDALDAMTIGVKCTTEIGTCEFQDWKTATLTAADSKTYDGNPYAASFELGEGFPTKYVTVSLEYWVKNGEELEDAPSAVGDYTVKMVASEGDTTKYTLEKDFAIDPADLSGATIALSTTSFNFDGYEKSVSISSVKFGNLTLTEGVDYEISEESVLKAAGEGRVDETFTVKIESIAGGNFVGEGSTTWTIVAGKERDDFKFGAGTASGDYGEVVDKTLTVTDSTKLVYNGDGTWSMAMDIAMPIDGNVGEHFVPTIRLYFRNPETGEIVIASNDDDCKNIGVAITSSKTLMGNYYYITKVVWTEKISLDEIEDAILAGDDKIVRTMKMWSPKWEQEIIRNVLTYDNHDGLPVTEYKMELPLADLVLPVPADETVDVDGTAFQADYDYAGYKLQLGKGAVVYAGENGLWNEDKKMIVDEGYEVAFDINGEGIWFFTPEAIEYGITYKFEGNDGNEPTNLNPEVYTVEDEITFEPAMLDGYEFEGWSPAKIEKGTIGDQTVTGTFKKSAVLPTVTYAQATVKNCEIGLTYTLDTEAIGYDDWNVDFVVKANKDVANGAITLWGSNPLDGETLVDFPAFAMTAGEPIKLLESQEISITYAQLVALTEGSYTCGVQNNSLAEDTEFTLKIVLSKEGEDDIVVDGSTFVATLSANILPTATVTPITEEDYEAAVEFATGKIGAGYDNWTAEFVLTSDVAIGADEIYLAGSYEAYLDGAWVEIPFPGCAAGEEISVLGLVGYDDITVKTAFDVIKCFKCGVKNIALKNDATFALKLVITDGETTKEICSIDGLTVEKKASKPVVPGEPLVIPPGKTPEEYVEEAESNKATLLKAPVELTGVDLATYQSYFTAQVVGETVQFVLNATGEQAVKDAIEATKPDVLAVALSADEDTFTVAEPLKGFYYSFKQGGELTNLGFVKVGDKNQIGDEISFELIKPEGKGFYQTIITSVPYVEE